MSQEAVSPRSRFLERITSIFVKNERIRSDVMLNYYLEMTGTDYLHWGYWEDGDALDLTGVRTSQERYVDVLMSHIPSDVKTILDVGCGIGAVAKRLRAAGYDVVSMSPDPYQQQLFLERTDNKIPFVLSGFEDWEPDRQFDMILMSESVQYIPLDPSFTKARAMLRPGGYILSSDYYRLENSRGLTDRHLPSHYLQDYLEKAAEYGFSMLHEQDISKQVTPTLEYGRIVFKHYIKPTLRAQLLALEVHVPLVYRMFRRLLRLPIKGEPVETIVRNNLVPLDPELFRNYMKYMVYLFRRND